MLTAGVNLLSEGRARARVWAPACKSIDFVVDPRDGGVSTPSSDAAQRIVPLDREADGFFSGVIPGISAGTRYWYRLDGNRLRPDPVSRYQPDGPHGPSAVIDPSAYRWSDAGWKGVGRDGQVLYEMHVGTFTPAGTWRAALAELEELARLGVTIVEMMPVADFAGRFGWGYDGVNLYAPTRLYGTPDDLRAFVDRAHAVGLGVILDVVYNHFGPDGNYLAEFSPDYFTDRYTNDWGRAINFEGPRPARELFVENAAYWIGEFHFDGLRLDATQDVRDASTPHVLRDIAASARAAAGARGVYVIAENETQDTTLVRSPETNGYGLDALWNDDYHHAASVALLGRREAYYTDYNGSPQEFISCARFGHLYQGQWYRWQKKRRGTPGLDLCPSSFIAYLENHDQIANSGFGRRMHQLACPARYRALTALTLLGPATPLLFQGQEFGASSPFLFFADQNEELREPIRKGRLEFLAQFPSLHDPSVQAALPHPDAEDTFMRSKLDLSERSRHAEAYALHRDLLAIRRTDPVIAAAAGRRPEGAVIAPHAFVLRYAGNAGNDRLLIVNLGSDLDLTPVPEPLLAPPTGRHWEPQWSSEAVAYGGQGTPPLRPHSTWHIPAEAAVLLRAQIGPPDDAPDDDR